MLVFQSCTKEEDMQAMQAPKLPSEQMMVMDFNGFEQVEPDQRSFSNWFHAAVNVYFWTRTVYEILHVPVIALQVAFHQQAEYRHSPLHPFSCSNYRRLPTLVLMILVTLFEVWQS